MLTVKEAAERCRLSQSLLYDLCASGEIPHLRVGRPGKRGKVLLREEDLNAYLSSCRVGGPKPDEDLTYL